MKHVATPLQTVMAYPHHTTLSPKEPSCTVFRSTKKLGRLLPRFVDDIGIDEFDIVTPPQLIPPHSVALPEQHNTRSRKAADLKLSISAPFPVLPPLARRASIASTASRHAGTRDQTHKQAAHKRRNSELPSRELHRGFLPNVVEMGFPLQKPESSRPVPPRKDSFRIVMDDKSVNLETSTQPDCHEIHPSPQSSKHPMIDLPTSQKLKQKRRSEGKSVAGSNFGGAEFKAARRAKEAGLAEVEIIRCVGLPP